MQKAAVQRALIIERHLNLELTELIRYQYKLNKGWVFKYILYIIFILGTGLFALFILEFDLSQFFTNPFYISKNSYLKSVIFLLIFSLIALFLIFHFYKYKPREDYEDWTVDTVECKVGDMIGITLTNLNEKDSIKCGCMGKIKGQDFKEPYEVKETMELVLHNNIGPENNFTWFINTKDWEEGVYQIRPKNRIYPLQRKIRVMDESKVYQLQKD